MAMMTDDGQAGLDSAPARTCSGGLRNHPAKNGKDSIRGITIATCCSCAAVPAGDIMMNDHDEALPDHDV
jgi:hypothetical protein